MSNTADIFLSYSRDDQSTARLFAEGFERESFTVWWDVTLKSGEDYDKVTEAALRSAKAVVVLWSPRSVESRWVRTEATIALQNKTLAPVMIEDCVRPLMFELSQTTDLRHWQGDADDTAWHTLLADVRHRVDSRVGGNDGVQTSAAPTLTPPKQTASPTRKTKPSATRASTRLWLAGCVIASLLGAGAMWWLKPAPQADRRISRFVAPLPAEQLGMNQGRTVFTVAPDGRHYAWRARDGLYVRDMAQLEAQRVAGTDTAIAMAPVFSPDGSSLAWFNTAGQLLSLTLPDGSPVVIANESVELPTDSNWSANGDIYYNQQSGIWRVPARGGKPELVIAPEGRGYLGNPRLLSDGDTLLFTELREGLTSDSSNIDIMAQSLTRGERKLLVEGGRDPQYLASGHLLYVVNDSLYAVAFDVSTLSVTGGSVALVQGLTQNPVVANYRVTTDGTLFYLVNTVVNLLSPVWVSRDGSEAPLPVNPDIYGSLRIAPDGLRVNLGRSTVVGSGVWVWDFAAATLMPLTIGEARGYSSAWTPDSSRLAYLGSGNNFDWKAANNTGQSSRMTEFTATGTNNPVPGFFTPDATHLVYTNQTHPDTQDDIEMIAVGGTAEPVPLLHEPGNERNPVLSPNGRWMAYSSDESGRFEVYVRPFPDVDTDRVQVSNAGGIGPLWSPDGKELYYLQTGGQSYLQQQAGGGAQLMAATVAADAPRFSFSARNKVMDWPYAPGARSYDIAPDGTRFLALKPFRDNATQRAEVMIVQNWTQELQRLVPVQ